MDEIHIIKPYILCPHCNEQIECTPDFEFYINYVPEFGKFKSPIIQIRKSIPIKRILNDELLKQLQEPLHDFLIKIAFRKPLFCTAILTQSTYKVFDKMIGLNVITHEEIYPEI